MWLFFGIPVVVRRFFVRFFPHLGRLRRRRQFHTLIFCCLFLFVVCFQELILLIHSCIDCVERNQNVRGSIEQNSTRCKLLGKDAHPQMTIITRFLSPLTSSWPSVQCAKLEEEVAMHKGAEPVTAACEQWVRLQCRLSDEIISVAQISPSDFLSYSSNLFLLVNRIVSEILKTPDPFCTNKAVTPNPWHSSNSSDGGCCVVS